MSEHNAQPEREPLQALLDQPYEFTFVQTVRHLYRHAISQTLEDQRIGWDNFPDQEVVRFHVAPTLRHTSSEVVSVSAPPAGETAYVVTVPFMGLIGASGVLPRHYSQMVMGRVKKGDYAMRDFFDLFHHRIISNFFRASVKYRLPRLREMTVIGSSTGDDQITRALKHLVGYGESKTRDRLPFHDDTLIYYSGHFSRRIPTAVGLEETLSDFIGQPARVNQFQFEWLYIDPIEQTCLEPESMAQLGVSTVIGERVPSFQTRFRICLGPLNWDDFSNFQPNSQRINEMAAFIRTFVGIAYDFDLQIAVKGADVPPLELGGQSPANLGWNSWMLSEKPDRVLTDAIFELSPS